MDNLENVEYREVTGIMPPKENPTKFRLYRTRIESDTYLHWVNYWVKDFEIWVPCSSTVWELKGCRRVMRTEFDSGSDIFHKMILDEGDCDYSLVIQAKDHCSVQKYGFLRENIYPDPNERTGLRQSICGLPGDL